MNLSILRLLAAVVIAFFAGKLISKLKLPSILGDRRYDSGAACPVFDKRYTARYSLVPELDARFGMRRGFDDWN